MNVKRRSLLKGMALAGVAMGGPSLAMGALLGSTAPLPPSLALVSGEAASTAFLKGLAATPGAARVTVQRTDLSLDFVLELQQRLNSRHTQRIIGLVDDASAALIVDLARSAGARLQWLGQHGVASWVSHHNLLSTDSASGCALQLGRQLNACGHGFTLSAQQPHGRLPPMQLSAPARTGLASSQWASTLGFALATLNHAGDFPAALVDDSATPLSGHFVSFSIEV